MKSTKFIALLSTQAILHITFIVICFLICFGPDNLKMQYSFNVGGKLCKQELDPERKIYLTKISPVLPPRHRKQSFVPECDCHQY